jgi:hypothetical protein
VIIELCGAIKLKKGGISMLAIIKANKKIPVMIGLLLFILCFTMSYSHVSKANREDPQYIQALMAFDVTNDQKLVGWADNVFVGKVIAKTGDKSRYDLPEMQFDVEISENIKGELKERITVMQQGGYKDGQLLLFQDDKIIEEGKTYLFVTRYDKAEEWHILVPAYGDIELSSEVDTLKQIDRFKEAFSNQIKYNPKAEEYWES